MPISYPRGEVRVHDHVAGEPPGGLSRRASCGTGGAPPIRLPMAVACKRCDIDRYGRMVLPRWMPGSEVPVDELGGIPFRGWHDAGAAERTPCRGTPERVNH